MERRDRHWFCKNCGYVYHRRKADRYQSCGRCGHQMVKTRQFPWTQRKAAMIRYGRQAAKKEMTKKPFLRIRNLRTRRLIAISRETRIAYRSMQVSRTRKTFERSAASFLDRIATDFFTCHHGVRWPDRCSACQEQYNHSYGGATGLPKVVVMDRIDGGYTLGQYRRDLLRGIYQIAIQWESRKETSQMAQTMAHEVVHWMDTYFSSDHRRVGCSSHDKTFYARVEDLVARVSVPTRRIRRRRRR